MRPCCGVPRGGIRLVATGVSLTFVMEQSNHWEEDIGSVSHYYNGIHVAAIKIEHGHLKAGDKLHFMGRTTDFVETIEGMEINHTDVREAGRGAYVGILVHHKVREHDHVYLIHKYSSPYKIAYGSCYSPFYQD